MFSFRTVQGGTNKLERHFRQHTQNRSNANCFVRTFPRAARQTVERAAALAVALDVRALPFCDVHLVVSKFAQKLFELGQTVPVNEKLDPASHLPGKTAAHNAVQEIAKERRREVVKAIREGCLKNGGAASVDGVHVKVSGKHFYDFKVHYMVVKKTKPYDEPKFSIQNKTLLLAEGAEVSNASNIRETLVFSLLEKYQTSL